MAGLSFMKKSSADYLGYGGRLNSYEKFLPSEVQLTLAPSELPLVYCLCL